MRTAILWSSPRHRKPFTSADNRHDAQLLLKDEEWAGLNNREIARACVVNESTVRRIREEESLRQNRSEPVTAPSAKPSNRRLERAGPRAHQSAIASVARTLRELDPDWHAGTGASVLAVGHSVSFKLGG